MDQHKQNGKLSFQPVHNLPYVNEKKFAFGRSTDS